MLDLDGHVKLTDFGLAKERCGRSYSFCGSPEYMSPEMLTRDGHGLSLDCYSLGALLFEMLTGMSWAKITAKIGLPPHYSRNRQQMYQRILNEQVIYPLYLSQPAVALLDLLLCKDPAKRPTATQIKSHPFLAGINWDDLYNKRVEPPYVPDIRTSHFDPEYTSLRVTWSEGDDTHELNLRSQSVGELRETLPEDEAERNETSHNETSRPPVDAESVASRNRQFDSKLGKQRGSLAHDWEKELFPGYAFVRGTELRTRSSGTAKNTGGKCTVCKKPAAVKATSLPGESDEPDILITETNRSGEESRRIERVGVAKTATLPLLQLQSGKTFANAPERHRLAHIALRRAKPVPPEPFSVRKGGAEASTFSQKLAQYETCSLLRGERSRVTAGIIKLNDELHGVVSERRRNSAVRKPLEQPKGETPTRKGARAGPQTLKGQQQQQQRGNSARKRVAKTPSSSRWAMSPSRLATKEGSLGWTADTQGGNRADFEQSSAAATMSNCSSHSASPKKAKRPAAGSRDEVPQMLFNSFSLTLSKCGSVAQFASSPFSGITSSSALVQHFASSDT